MRIRPFRAGDEPALADICLKTADAGADATGLLDDDAVWAQIFVLPYVARHPDLAFVVAADDDRPVGPSHMSRQNVTRALLRGVLSLLLHSLVVYRDVA